MLQVVQRGVLYMVPPRRGSEMAFHRRAVAQHAARHCVRPQQVAISALKHHPSAVVARARPHVHKVVRHCYDFAVVLHYQHRVAVVPQVAQRLFQPAYVLWVKPHTGLVQHIGHIREGRIDIFRYLDALCLAAAQGASATSQREVAQPYVAQRLQPFAKLVFQVGGQRMLNARYECQRLVDGHTHHVGQILSLYAATAHAFVQPCAVTFRAFRGARHPVQYLLLPLALLGGDDAAVHAWVQPFKFGRLWPVVGRVLQPYLWRIQQQLHLLGAVVAYFLVQVEQPTVCIAFPSPSPGGEGGEMYHILVVQTLVEVHQLVDVQVGHLAQSRTARAHARRVVERKGVAIPHKGFANTREQQSQQGVNISVCGHC